METILIIAVLSLQAYIFYRLGWFVAYRESARLWRETLEAKDKAIESYKNTVEAQKDVINALNELIERYPKKVVS